MLNRIIEIHDSELESIAINSEHVVLDFSAAYIHQSDGRPAVHAGSGWVQRASLRIQGSIKSGAFHELPCDLSDGSITINGEKFDNTIPIPLDREGKIKLDLTSMFGEKMHIEGKHVRLELIGEAKYVEEFPG